MKPLSDDRGRPRVFTDRMLARIPLWIIDGWSLEAIAERIGTSPGSLYATCSRLNISLKGANRPIGKRDVSTAMTLRLPKRLAQKIERRATEQSMSTEHLIILLLEQIASDDLFDAVLDFNDADNTKT